MREWNFLAIIGRLFIRFLASIGHLVLFTATALRHLFAPPFFWRISFQQMLRIGYFSLPVVGLTAIFTGAVLALQIYIGGSRFNAESFVGQVVVISMVRELGPVLAALKAKLFERSPQGYTLTGRHGWFAPYEAFAMVSASTSTAWRSAISASANGSAPAC